MEIDAITEMFRRSVSKHGVKYVQYIADGDSKTFKGILDSKPYGDEITVQKKECVGHVEKRMGTRLRQLKKQYKGIGGKGKGKLTDKVIGELTQFYGLAIRRNSDSVEEMKTAIWASLEHCSSSDKNAQHSKCPPSKDSWCKWHEAEASGTLATFKHDRVPLAPSVVKLITPIYESLSSDTLLERCLGAHTQNNNESVNSCIWMLAPKHLHSGKQVVETATHFAVMIINEGFSSILKTMENLGITLGPQAEMCAAQLDETRIDNSERRMSDAAKRARIQQREDHVANQEHLRDEEGELYGPGIAD